MLVKRGIIAHATLRAPGPKLSADDFPDLKSIVETWDKVEGYVREYGEELLAGHDGLDLASAYETAAEAIEV